MIVCVIPKDEFPQINVIASGAYKWFDLRGHRHAAECIGYELERYIEKGESFTDKMVFVVSYNFMRAGRYHSRLQRLAHIMEETRWYDIKHPNTYTTYKGFN